MNINYVIVECDCEVSHIAVKDLQGEDCRLWEKRNQIQNDNEICLRCGKMPFISIAYVGMAEPAEITKAG